MLPAECYPAGRGEWEKTARVIAHLDMDAFYASVEILDFPDLRDRPVIVGGSSKRGVVSAASYRARDFGIHSAMPVFMAKRLCPDLVVQPVRMKRYSQVSRAVMDILQGYSPLVEQISIDEAYVDLTGTGKLFGTPEETAVSIKRDILEKTSLTSSIGLSTCKLVSKIASDINKPDGITIVPSSRVGVFLEKLPVGKIPGVGGKSEDELEKLGIRRLGEVRKFSPAYLEERFGKFGRRLLAIAAGGDDSPVTPWSAPKSISNELTFPEDTDDIDLMQKHLLALSEMVGHRLRKHGMKGKTVTLKLKNSDHRLITRSVTLDKPTHQGGRIYKEAKKLLVRSAVAGKKRLIGVGVSNLEPAGEPGQMLLFGESSGRDDKWDRVDRAVDDILGRFGPGAVKRGGLDEG